MDQVESGDPPAEIIISTLPQTRSGWMRRDLVERVRDDAKLPVEHVVVDVEPTRRPAHDLDRRAHDMPAPEERVHVSAYHESLLQSPVFLGMVMFIGSEIMLFGSFFTAYFYIRFSHGQYPFGDFEIPKATTGINTAILVPRRSRCTGRWCRVRRGRRLGPDPGPGPDAADGSRPSWACRCGSTTPWLRALRRRLPDHVLRTHRPARDARVHRRHAAGDRLRARLSREYAPDDHLGLEVTGLYWHFVDVVWIFLYTVVYLL